MENAHKTRNCEADMEGTMQEGGGSLSTKGRQARVPEEGPVLQAGELGRAQHTQGSAGDLDGGPRGSCPA